MARELTELDFSAISHKERTATIAEESAKGTIINFGFTHEKKRDKEQNKINEKVIREMPKFGIRGKFVLEARRYALWQHIRKLNGGKDPTYIYQQTGSCVGASWGNMSLQTQGVEIALKGDREKYMWIWWPYTYGKGRQIGGIRGRGDGSFGSAQAEAGTTAGQFELDPAGEPDLPDPKIQGGWAALTSAQEIEWSDGAAIKPNWQKVGATHLFKTAAAIRTTGDATSALANGYLITCASMFGFSPMIPPVKGKSPNQVRLVERWNAQWAHQMLIDEFWDHPDLGPIFGWLNQWGADAHGDPPSDYPRGHYYTTEAILAQILRSGDCEAFAHSGMDGFAAREEELRLSDFDAFGGH